MWNAGNRPRSLTESASLEERALLYREARELMSISGGEDLLVLLPLQLVFEAVR